MISVSLEYPESLEYQSGLGGNEGLCCCLIDMKLNIYVTVTRRLSERERQKRFRYLSWFKTIEWLEIIYDQFSCIVFQVVIISRVYRQARESEDQNTMKAKMRTDCSLALWGNKEHKHIISFKNRALLVPCTANSQQKGPGHAKTNS